MRGLLSPRFWVLVWSAMGALFVAYLIFSASVQTKAPKTLSALNGDAGLLVGEMAKFNYAVVGGRAPETPFELGDGSVSLKDFRGKTVLVNLWATWCAPCLKELPSLDALEAELGGDDFAVVAIAADPQGADVAQEFLDRLKIKNLKLYMDPRLIFASTIGGADRMPVSILYGPDGREIGRVVGDVDWASEEANRFVSSAIP